MAEPGTFGGALDQAGDVGDHEAGIARPDHAERGVERGERIVGDFRTRARHRADEGGLACVRQAEQADVGQHAQLQRKAAALAGSAARELTGGAVDARLEVQVAQAALTAAREQRALAVAGEIGHQRAARRVADQGAHRHAQLDVAARPAVAVGAGALAAALRTMDAREAVVDQRVDVAVGARPHAAAAAAVAAVGAAARHGPLAPERSGAVTALAGVHLDLGFVDELHGPEMKKPYRSRQGFFEGASGLRRRVFRDYAHGLARVLAFHRILHLASDVREQRVVTPHADVGAGMHLRAALAHQDLPGVDALAAERLDAEALGVGIAPVARAAARFLVSHALPLQDIVYADLGVRLPMALRFLVVLAPAQLEDLQFLAASVRQHRALRLGAGAERRAHLQVVAFADEQHLVERDRRADFRRQRLDAHLGARLDAVLLAA